MNAGNTSTEDLTDIKVENESYDEVEIELNLYADHVIKEEMVIGPVVFQPVVNTVYSPEDVPVPKKPKLETTDEDTDQVNTQKGMQEDNTERISKVDFTLSYNEKTNCYELQKCNQTPRISGNVFICNECGKKFLHKYKLAQHVGCHTKKLSCTYCNYKCKQKGVMASHLRTHSGEKPYSCSHCNYKFNQKGNLLKHLRTHTGEKPFSCYHCSYKCNQKGNLLKHLRTHTGEKPFSCPHCDYKCNVKGSLTSHLRTHTGEKPYSCSHCSFKCSEKGTLTTHLRVHTGEKPYSCSYCDYKCTVKFSLANHLRVHTGEKPYLCSHCDYRCSHKGNLARHFRTHNGEKTRRSN